MWGYPHPRSCQVQSPRLKGFGSGSWRGAYPPSKERSEGRLGEDQPPRSDRAPAGSRLWSRYVTFSIWMGRNGPVEFIDGSCLVKVDPSHKARQDPVQTVIASFPHTAYGGPGPALEPVLATLGVMVARPSSASPRWSRPWTRPANSATRMMMSEGIQSEGPWRRERMELRLTMRTCDMLAVEG
jgi:hypothetical protein